MIVAVRGGLTAADILGAHARQRRRGARSTRCSSRRSRSTRRSACARSPRNGCGWRGRGADACWLLVGVAAVRHRTRAPSRPSRCENAPRWRNRDHPSYWAFLVHRVSGLALALFLPLHFWALGTGARRRGRARRLPALDRAAAGQGVRSGARLPACRASRRGRAPAADRVRRLARRRRSGAGSPSPRAWRCSVR